MGLFDKLFKKNNGEKAGDSKREPRVARRDNNNGETPWGQGFASRITVRVTDFEGNAVEFQNVEMTREQLRYAVKDVLYGIGYEYDIDELLDDCALDLDPVDLAEVLMGVEDVLGTNPLPLYEISPCCSFSDLCDLLAKMIFPKK